MTEALRVLIADDEPDARAKIRRLLEEIPNVTIVAEARNGSEAVGAINTTRPDVAFLDIRMPEMDGFGVIESLGETTLGPKIVFVTAYDEYAVRAFEVRAIDYILKPFDADRLKETISRVREQQEYEHPSTSTLRSLLSKADAMDEATPEPESPKSTYLERVCIRSLGRTQFIRVSDIEWIEAYGNYVRLHTSEGRSLLRQPLRNFATQLDPAEFCRVHRSAVVNLNCVGEMRPCYTGDYLLHLRSGARVKLSRVYRGDFDRRLGRRL